jgi:hypothetical protein
VRGDFAVQLDGDRGLANGLERLDELNLAAVDFKALGLELVCNVGRGDGAEEVSVLARLAGESENQRLELSGQGFGNQPSPKRSGGQPRPSSVR